jgi:diguanylate cyclase (GGDEF)-like protein
LLAAGLAPTLALSIPVLTSQRAELEDAARQNLASQAQLQAAAVANILDQAAESITVLAANPALRDAQASLDEILAQLEAFDSFEEVTLLHPKGVVIESTSYGFAGRWDANAAFRGAREGRLVMTPPLYYPDPERLVVEFAAPVRRGQDVIAVVVGSLNMERVWRALERVSIGQAGYFVAFDSHGNVIAHPDRRLLLRKLEGYVAIDDPAVGTTTSYVSPDGDAYVVRSAPVGDTGWSVAALQPEAEAYALVNDTVRRAVLAAFVVLLVTIVIALLISRAITHPLRVVGRAMRLVARGELDQRVHPSGLEEIDALTSSFNGMTEKLEERDAALQLEMAERDRAERRIAYLAYHDPLTGLPNRALMADRLHVALAESRRSGEPLAVLYLDIDRFKHVNDTVGHALGDVLLKNVSDSILAVTREGDSLARVGGDEYILLLPRVSGATEAVEVARRVLAALRKPWELENRTYHITASIGIALHPEHGADGEALIRNADTAMYRAKEDGRDGVAVFDEHMDAGVKKRVALEQDLRVALARSQFALHYQPQIDAETRQVIGVEALLRWHHPRQGTISAQDFIDVAEDTGMIWDIGRWVLHKACADVRAWNQRGIGPGLTVSVNISARQFHDTGLVDDVREALARAGLPARRLDLEITESTAMRDVEHSVRTLNQLKDMGVSVSIDDFGTGYSSLSYLKRFPIDTVKIDRSFVADVAHDGDDAAIVGAIVAVAGSLNMRTVAEGVETEEQLTYLRGLQCRVFQGFLFSPALPILELGKLLADVSGIEHEERSGAPVGSSPRPVLPGAAGRSPIMTGTTT